MIAPCICARVIGPDHGLGALRTFVTLGMDQLVASRLLWGLEPLPDWQALVRDAYARAFPWLRPPWWQVAR